MQNHVMSVGQLTLDSEAGTVLCYPLLPYTPTSLHTYLTTYTHTHTLTPTHPHTLISHISLHSLERTRRRCLTQLSTMMYGTHASSPLKLFPS